MIEDGALIVIYIMAIVPMAIAAIAIFLTRPDKFYYKSTYCGRFRKIPIRPRGRKDK